jgi:hypothetical protein
MATLPESGEYTGWERTWKLVLHFSEPVDLASAAEALSSEPSLTFVLETPPGYGDKAVFSFTPLYGSRYTLKLGKGVKDGTGNVSDAARSWKIKAGGADSKPPLFAGFRIPLEPGAADEKPRLYSKAELLADLPLQEEFFPFDSAVPVWIELYFETAPSALPDLFSLMDHFKVSATNNALGFSPREFRLSGFTLEEAAEGWESLLRVELRGMLTNRPYMGMVTFEAGAGLTDDRGNASTEAVRILLLK